MIIDWDKHVHFERDEKTKKDIFLHTLSGKSCKWRGKCIISTAPKHKMEAPFIQIRGTKGLAQILISVGVKKPETSSGGAPIGKVSTEPCVLMSQNGTAEYQATDFIELNQAVLEAQAVYESMVTQRNALKAAVKKKLSENVVAPNEK